MATNGRPGPVWLDIPLDIQSSIINEGEFLEYDKKEDEIILKDGKVIKKLKDSLSSTQKTILGLLDMDENKDWR